MNNPFASADDMWRRSGVRTEALVQLAEANAVSVITKTRDALWGIKALRDEPLPLFAAAAEREAAAIAEQQEPKVALRQMTDGQRHSGLQPYRLTLRQHPVSFLRNDLLVRDAPACGAGASMMAVNGRIQREGEVVHLVAQQLFDLSGDLVGLADRDTGFKLPTGRGDEFAHSGGGRICAIDRSRLSRGTCSCRIFISIR